MYANLTFLKKQFNEFNNEIFAGGLPEIKLRTSRSRRTMGTLRYRKSASSGKTTYSDFTLTVSSCLDLPENVIEDTLIHEMIHLYILVHRLEDTSAHGKVFKTLMDTINKRHNRNITISHRTTESESASDTARRHHYILLTKFRNGESYITVVSRTKIFETNRSLSSIKEIERWEWRYSTDPHFNRFPRSRSLKFYKMPPETSRAILQTRLCKCDNNSFRFA